MSVAGNFLVGAGVLAIVALGATIWYEHKKAPLGAFTFGLQDSGSAKTVAVGSVITLNLPSTMTESPTSTASKALRLNTTTPNADGTTTYVYTAVSALAVSVDYAAPGNSPSFSMAFIVQ